MLKISFVLIYIYIDRNSFSTLSLHLSIYSLYENINKWSTSDNLIGDNSNQETSNKFNWQMSIRNTTKTGSISFTICKQLIKKMFPCFHTIWNLIISSHSLECFANRTHWADKLNRCVLFSLENINAFNLIM